MEFSSPIQASRGLVLQIPETSIVVSVNGKELHVNTLPLLSRLQTIFVPSAPHFLVCSHSPPYVIAAACHQHVTVAALADEPLEAASPDSKHVSRLVTFQLDSAMAVEAVGITRAALLVFHANRIGVSIFALSHRSISQADVNHRLLENGRFSIMAPRSIPAFLPFFASPLCPSPPTVMPCTAAFSPCGWYAAIGVRLASSPALQIVALSSGTILAQAVGVAALGGSITEVCGVRWLTSPQNCIFVWGLPRDGLDAMCLIGVDGDLIQAGMPLNSFDVASDTKARNSSGEKTSAGNDAQKGTLHDDKKESADALYYFRDLGVRSTALSPDNGMIAVGCFDGTVRLINVSTWRLVLSLNFNSPCVDDQNPPAVYLERVKLVPCDSSEDNYVADEENKADIQNVPESRPPSSTNLAQEEGYCLSDCSRGVEMMSFFDVVDGHGRVVVPPPASAESSGGGAAEATLQCGVAALQFSADGRWLSVRSEKLRNVVFVVDVIRARLASTVALRDEARCMSWSTQRTRRRGVLNDTADALDDNIEDSEEGGARLAIVTDGDSIYFWSERGAAALRVPPGLIQVSTAGTISEATRAVKNRRLRGPGAAAHPRAPQKGFRARRFLWSSGDETALVIDPTCSSSFSVMYMA